MPRMHAELLMRTPDGRPDITVAHHVFRVWLYREKLREKVYILLKTTEVIIGDPSVASYMAEVKVRNPGL
jgi:hypothetical protein